MAFNYAHDVTLGEDWNDFTECDHDDWDFSNPDADIHAVHRDGGEDEITTCLYGEFGGDQDSGVSWGFTFFDLYDNNNNRPDDDEENVVTVSLRMWAWCNWQNSDNFDVYIYDEYTGNNNANQKVDWENRYDNSARYMTKQKRDNTCNLNGDPDDPFTWETQAEDGDPDWYQEVTCIEEQGNTASCWSDVEFNAVVTGPTFGLLFMTEMDDPPSRAQWAWSDISITFRQTPPPNTNPCCTGRRDDKPRKSCGAFHEMENCENKGCDWDSNNPACMIDCCRFADRSRRNKEKATCKDYNNPPDNTNRQACLRRDECDMTMCDVIGMGDNTDGTKGNGQ